MSRGERVRDRIAQEREDAGDCRRSPHRAGDPAHHCADQLLQLVLGGAIARQIGAEGIADLRSAVLAAGVLAEQVHLVFSAQLATRARWWPDIVRIRSAP